MPLYEVSPWHARMGVNRQLSASATGGSQWRWGGPRGEVSQVTHTKAEEETAEVSVKRCSLDR